MSGRSTTTESCGSLIRIEKERPAPDLRNAVKAPSIQALFSSPVSGLAASASRLRTWGASAESPGCETSGMRSKSFRRSCQCASRARGRQRPRGRAER